MERLGFKAIFVNTDDSDSLLSAMRTYAHDDDLLKSTVTSNQRYIEEHEDFERQMTLLLHLIDEVVQSHR